MALNDILLVEEGGAFGSCGSIQCNVAASATIIYPGDPVKTTSNNDTLVVTVAATNEPVVATTLIAGVAISQSTNTATAAGVVNVRLLTPGQIYEMKPTTAITSQATYDGYLGYRVRWTLASGVYTLQVTDGATYGCIIVPNDIVKNPGRVRFIFRNACSFFN
jgi:hypothetical protein